MLPRTSPVTGGSNLYRLHPSTPRPRPPVPRVTLPRTSPVTGGSNLYRLHPSTPRPPTLHLLDHLPSISEPTPP